MTNSEYETLTLAEMMQRSWVTTDRIRSQTATIPKGTRVVVTGKRSGLTIQTAPCRRCGIQVSITRVRPWHVEEVL